MTAPKSGGFGWWIVAVFVGGMSVGGFLVGSVMASSDGRSTEPLTADECDMLITVCPDEPTTSTVDRPRPASTPVTTPTVHLPNDPATCDYWWNEAVRYGDSGQSQTAIDIMDLRDQAGCPLGLSTGG